ncbi:hypothetical protein Goklo_005779, partial [Gossypium klotzschianum]|nr:hypothetical protein [Gossypium klotzschianum]
GDQTRCSQTTTEPKTATSAASIAAATTTLTFYKQPAFITKFIRTTQKLKPPPAGSYLLLTSEPQTHSFRSTPRSHSERWRFDRPVQVHLECVSHGCFPSPLLRRKGSKRRSQKSEPDYVSDLETLSRWLVSSRKSLSPFYGSPMSSFLSFRSST